MPPRPAPLLEPGRNCWRIEEATRAAVIVDAADYFRTARAAMLSAKRQILLIGWDFDARIPLVPRGRNDHPEAPRVVGPFISWLVKRNPDLNVYLLRWDMGALKALVRGTTPLTIVRWMLHPRIHTKLDGFHPTGASHHQKVVVIDDCLAFCGGIDMTGERWDTRAHHDDERGRRTAWGRRYKPWHDATTALQGPAAAALGDMCRERWRLAGGKPIAAPTPGDCWPTRLVPQFEHRPVAISRTQPAMPDCAAVHEIERLYADLIARAKRTIYAESQYFASRRIAEAIVARLEEPDGPEIVVVNPEGAQGWLEPIAMDTARARLMEALRRRDPHGRLRMYHPYTQAGAPIYVHAKILVIDDRLLRVGSSNFNNRSLGLDTECDVTIEAEDDATAATIREIRDSLIAEHLGIEPAALAARIEAEGSLIGAIEALRGTGRSLRPYEPRDLSAVEAWLADNEVLDPERPEAMFEALAKRRGLLRGRLRRRRRRRDAARA